MMSNSIKKIQVNIQNLCKAMGIENIYTKDNRVKVAVVNKLDQRIRYNKIK
jgi:hypothetical protein